MSRPKGSKNKSTLQGKARCAYIYVRLTEDLKDWVLAHDGKSDSDKAVTALENCRQNHHKVQGKRTRT